MTTKQDIPIPQVFDDLARHAGQFADGVQRLRLSDDRGAVVSTEAQRFATLVRGAVDAMARPPAKGVGTGSVDQLAHDIAPAVETLGHMIEGFRRDAAADLAVLPDQNDLEIGMNLLAQAPEEVLRLVQLTAAQPWAHPSHERTDLRQCLVNAGVPVEQIDNGGPGTIKILFVAIIVLLIRTRPDMASTLIVLIVVVFRIDDGANGPKKKYCPCPGGQDGDGGGDDGGSGGGGGGAPVKCGDVVTVEAFGDAAQPAESALQAFRNGAAQAAERCPKQCPPKVVDVQTGPAMPLGNGQFRTKGTYLFRCT